MKTHIKIIAFFILYILIAVSCSKDKPVVFDGVISGPDMRKSVCCGGWFIEVEGETFRFLAVPDDCNIDLNQESFPLQVGVNWIKEAESCPGDEINLTRLV
ncbi:MAG: hypothetical protein ISR55_05800 [Bacteroidetes bacterium]|nr:hypothetical protein [Bacteroidota bacterium]MBL6963318.1 hypothetical protein [Bacteroidota bacterium]